MKSNRGISAIVATVLIILITVAAVTIIWAAIIPMIQDQVSGSTECFDASASLTVVSDYSCSNDSVTKVQVHRATGDFELVAVDLIVSKDGTTNTIRNESLVPDINGDVVYTLTSSESVGADEVSVAAIVRAGNTEKTCDKSGAVSLATCN
jgi:flagellin-like protein